MNIFRILEELYSVSFLENKKFLLYILGKNIEDIDLGPGNMMVLEGSITCNMYRVFMYINHSLIL